VWHPLSRCSWRSLLQHAVHLFERETLGLGDENVGVDEAEEAKRTPEEEHFGTEIGIAAAIADEVRRNNSDDLGEEISSILGASGWQDLRSSTASWKMWKEQHHENGLAVGKSRQ
jgi:hypothetical protein